jgi:hypothetical protein
MRKKAMFKLTNPLSMPSRIGFFLLVSTLIFLLGASWGIQHEGQKRLEEAKQESVRIVKQIQREQVIVKQVDVKYRDRIKKIYLIGEEIENSVRNYISPAAGHDISVPLGFVRVHDAAWSNTLTGTPSESDGEPTGISLVEVAEATAHNATSCRAWREQALVWREFYSRLKTERNAQ